MKLAFGERQWRRILPTRKGIRALRPLADGDGFAQLELTPVGRDLLEGVAQVHFDIANGANPEQASIKISFKARAFVDVVDDSIRSRAERSRSN